MSLKNLLEKYDKDMRTGANCFSVKDREEQIAEERLTSWADNGKACIGCIFASGEAPYGDAPDKCSCLIYPHPNIKPDSVYLEGKPCKHKRTAEEAKAYAKGSGKDKL